MTAIAPSPLPFTSAANRKIINDSPRSGHRSQQKNNSFRQHGGSAGAASSRNMNGVVSTATAASSTNALDGYGDGIKALLADPIKFEPYAKKVVVDEAKYKPINGEMEALDQASAIAGVSAAFWQEVPHSLLTYPSLQAIATAVLVRRGRRYCSTSPICKRFTRKRNGSLASSSENVLAQ
jgi:hypothetical protein